MTHRFTPHRWTRTILVWLLLVTAACRAPMTTVVLVRHAERPPGADPDLLPAGQARAESLAVALTRTHVAAIIHTQFRRTLQTAAPLATQKSLTPIVVNVSGTEQQHAQAVVQQINAFDGRTVVYVGHSNTVPAVLEALGLVAPVPQIPDTEYHHFFVVTKGRNETPSLIRVRYGQ
ncbi:MAG: histidine phosphatase family protein [Gemmatimonadaceae bacterium]